MITISLCMIVKDEAEVLGRCLESVGEAADEIIIVDTGSTDQTKEIAKMYTEHVFDYRWEDDFSAARNYALSRGNMEYLMWLDADDVLPESSRKKLLELKAAFPAGIDVVMMPYAVAFDEQGKSTFTYYRERIVKNNGRFWFEGRVHEVIPPAGNIFYAEIPVEHRKIGGGSPDRNLRIYEKMKASGDMFDARALYYYGRELVFHERYADAAEVLEQFLTSPDGWVENRIDAARKLAVCYREMGNEKQEIRSLLRTLEYDVPRGEACCDLGAYFMARGKYGQAAYWYGQALQAKKADTSGAFIEEECYGFIPAISLCVCYDRMGKYMEAEQYNELAGSYCPDSACYLENKKYFDGLRERTKKDS